MSVKAQYTLLLDVDSDETYKLVLPVEELEWENGLQNSYDTLAEVTQLTASLWNRKGELATGIFGDFTSDVREETIQNEALANNSFTAFTLGEPNDWEKTTYALGMTTSESASGGGAGTGSLHVTGTGHVAYAQTVTLLRNYAVNIVISEFSGDGQITLRAYDSAEHSSSEDILTITAAGTFDVRWDAESQPYFEVAIERLSGTFTVTIDSVSVQEVIITYGSQQPVQVEVLGDEIVTNGTFDLFTTPDVPDGWTVTDATVSEVGSGQDHTGAGTDAVNLYENTSGLTAGIRQSVPTQGGQKYKFVVVISYLAGVNARVQIGSPQQGTTPAHYVTMDNVGTHAFYLTSGVDNSELGTILTELRVIGASLPVEATVDSVSIRPVTFTQTFTPRTEVGYVLAPDTIVTERNQVRRGTLVKVLANYREITERQLWVGKLFDVRPNPKQVSEQRIQIVCRDPMEQLRDKNFLPEFQTDVTIDVPIEQMFKKNPVITFPYASSYWIVGVPGASEPGVTTRPYDGPPMSFDTGVAIVPFVGDNSDRGQPSNSDDRDLAKQGTSMLAFLRDCLQAEVDGRLFWNGRTSQFEFQNRHFDLYETAPALILSAWENGQFISSDKVYNQVTVHFQPREIGAEDSILWSHPNLPITIGPRSTVRINVRFTDPDGGGARIGAQVVNQLTKNADIVANSKADGTGASNYINLLSWHVQPGGAGAVVTISNTHRRVNVFVTTLQLRGTPIRTYQASSVTVDSGESLYVNDPQPYDYRAQLISDETEAEAVAHFLLSRYQFATRRFVTISYEAGLNDTLMRAMLDLTVGDRIRVVAPHVGHESNYTIVGEKHHIVMATGRHTVTYVLKPQAALNYWLLGDDVHSILGVSTYPVF